MTTTPTPYDSLQSLLADPTPWRAVDVSRLSELQWFLAQFPLSRSGGWERAWAAALPAQRPVLAELWLTRVLTSMCGPDGKTPTVSQFNATLVKNRYTLRTVYPYVSPAYLDRALSTFAAAPTVKEWLRPSGQQPWWSRFHQLWFGDSATQINALALFGAASWNEVWGELNPLLLNSIVVLSMDLTELPEATLQHRSARAFLFLAWGERAEQLPNQANNIDTAWWKTGRWLRQHDPKDATGELTDARFTQLRQEPCEIRVALMARIAENTKMNELGVLGTQTEMYRWCRRANPQQTQPTIFDAAALFVHEYETAWRSAQALGIPITQVAQTLPSLTALPRCDTALPNDFYPVT